MRLSKYIFFVLTTGILLVNFTAVARPRNISEYQTIHSSAVGDYETLQEKAPMSVLVKVNMQSKDELEETGDSWQDEWEIGELASKDPSLYKAIIKRRVEMRRIQQERKRLSETKIENPEVQQKIQERLKQLDERSAQLKEEEFELDDIPATISQPERNRLIKKYGVKIKGRETPKPEKKEAPKSESEKPQAKQQPQKPSWVKQMEGEDPYERVPQNTRQISKLSYGKEGKYVEFSGSNKKYKVVGLTDDIVTFRSEDGEDEFDMNVSATKHPRGLLQLLYLSEKNNQPVKSTPVKTATNPLATLPPVYNESLEGAIDTLSSTFNKMRVVVYVLGAFGFIGFAIAAIFGKLSWSWLVMITISLFVLASTEGIVSYATDAGGGSPKTITASQASTHFKKISPGEKIKFRDDSDEFNYKKMLEASKNHL